MELVTMIIAGTAIALTAALKYAVNKHLEIKQKNLAIESLRRSLNVYAETYSFEKADEELVEKCQDKIKELFKDGIENEFNKYKTVEEKKAFARKVVQELAGCMNLKVENIEIVNLGPYTRGAASPDSDPVTIYIHEALAIADPEQMVKTICHELKHCVQFKALTDNEWGYSPQRIAQYLYSWNNYVECSIPEEYDAYVNQIIEIDANKFVDEIFKA